MKKQWRRFLRQAKKERLYEHEFSYFAVPYLVKYLHRSMRAGCDLDVEDIFWTLRHKHGVTLDGKGELCFVRSDAVVYTDK